MSDGKSQNAAVKHVLSAIRPAQLRTRLEQDIAFSNNDLKANFDGFMAHALDVSAAFEKVDCGNPKSSKPEKDDAKPKKTGSHAGASSIKASAKP